MKTTRPPFAGLLPVATLLLTGCVQLAEIDSTSDPRYQAMIGREYALREEFNACGVKRDHQSPDFGHVVILPPPGLGGRFIADLGRVPAESRFRIVGVVTRRSKLFPSTEYVVSFLGPSIPRTEGKEVRIYPYAAWPVYEKPAVPDAVPQLSERYFRPLD